MTPFQQKLVAFTGPFEGCVLKAYLCPAGIPTLGYGHTKGVKPGDTCTQAQAEQWLLDDLQDAIEAVERLVTVPLNEGQKIALIDFVFNCGAGNFKASTLLKCVNARRFQAAAEELPKWNRARGVPLAGLTKRRTAERNIFVRGTV